MKELISLLVLLVIYGHFSDGHRLRNPLARLSINAKVRGVYERADNGKLFRSFTAIPYAQPPIGQNRFKEPEPATLWKGTLNGTSPSPSCLQRDLYFNGNSLIGQEDCLYLNVYSPMLSRKYRNHFPVLVFLHGPTFFTGSGSLFRPHRLLSHDVVLVTFNYRLGPFGFLSTGDSASPGNYALLDQVLALQWVHKHISSFGGDKSRVTLFGQGSGAQMVIWHQLSHQSQGLFHAAIIQGGSPLCQPNVPVTPLTMSHELGRRVQCPYTSSTEDLIACLRSVNDPSLFFNDPDPLLPLWGPLITNGSSKPFLHEDPIHLLRKSDGILTPMPVIIGVTQDYTLTDGPSSFFHRLQSSVPPPGDNRSTSQVAKEVVELVLFSAVFHVSDPEKAKLLLDAVMDEYFDHLDLEGTTFIRGLAELFADALINPCMYETAKLLSTKLTTRFYSFEHSGNVSFTHNPTVPPGLAMWDDLLYLFRVSQHSDKLVGTDALVSKSMVELWTNFAKYDNPTPRRTDLQWTPMPNASLSLRVPYFRIDDQLSMEPDFRPRHMDFWLVKVPNIVGDGIIKTSI